MKYFIFLLSFFSCRITTWSQQKSKSPNLLLNVIDDLGYYDFNPYANHKRLASTLNMDMLAKAGKIFTQAYNTATLPGQES